jgi:hypothetical protein
MSNKSNVKNVKIKYYNRSIGCIYEWYSAAIRGSEKCKKSHCYSRFVFLSLSLESFFFSFSSPFLLTHFVFHFIHIYFSNNNNTKDDIEEKDEMEEFLEFRKEKQSKVNTIFSFLISLLSSHLPTHLSSLTPHPSSLTHPFISTLHPSSLTLHLSPFIARPTQQ